VHGYQKRAYYLLSSQISIQLFAGKLKLCSVFPRIRALCFFLLTIMQLFLENLQTCHSEYADLSSSSELMKVTLTALHNSDATVAKETASAITCTLLEDTALYTTLFTVPPIPSTTSFPRNIAKKCHVKFTSTDISLW